MTKNSSTPDKIMDEYGETTVENTGNENDDYHNVDGFSSSSSQEDSRKEKEQQVMVNMNASEYGDSNYPVSTKSGTKDNSSIVQRQHEESRTEMTILDENDRITNSTTIVEMLENNHESQVNKKVMEEEMSLSKNPLGAFTDKNSADHDNDDDCEPSDNDHHDLDAKIASKQLGKDTTNTNIKARKSSSSQNQPMNRVGETQEQHYRSKIASAIDERISTKIRLNPLTDSSQKKIKIEQNISSSNSGGLLKQDSDDEEENDNNKSKKVPSSPLDKSIPNDTDDDHMQTISDRIRIKTQTQNNAAHSDTKTKTGNHILAQADDRINEKFQSQIDNNKGEDTETNGGSKFWTGTVSGNIISIPSNSNDEDDEDDDEQDEEVGLLPRNANSNLDDHPLSQEASEEENNSSDNQQYDTSDNEDDTKDDDDNLAIAVALNATDDTSSNSNEEAVEYDPLFSKQRMTKRIRLWTIVALLFAIVLSTTLGIVLTRKHSKSIKETIENETYRTDAPTLSPTQSPTSVVASLLAQRIQMLYGNDDNEDGSVLPLWDEQTMYGEAFQWMSQDPITQDYVSSITTAVAKSNSVRVNHNETAAAQIEKSTRAIEQRYFFALFYYSMSGSTWTNCSSAITVIDRGDDNSNCTHLDRDANLQKNKKRWLGPYHECEWAGLTCKENQPNIVAEMNINKLGLFGSIPSEISHLHYLEELYVINNFMYGTIPKQIEALHTTLKALDLRDNKLWGSIPLELYSLTKLQDLTLGYNEFSGPIAPHIGNLTSLKGLHLSENDLSGTIPSEIGKLANSLSYLTISNNRFEGNLPTEIKQLTNLKGLFFEKNNFTGELQIPVADELTYLPISHNQFNGSIPENVYSLKQLMFIEANNNEFTGELKSHIGNMTKLRLINFRENKLSGSIPTEIQNLEHLEFLLLHRNNFNGTVPDEICSLRNFKLTMFSADCKNKIGTSNTAEVQCLCCTDCCDPNGSCIKRPD